MSSRVKFAHVWDNVPHPGPEPDFDDPKIDDQEAVRRMASWYANRRRYVLAQALKKLDEPLTTEERIVEVDKAVRSLGAMVLCGEVGPDLLLKLFNL